MASTSLRGDGRVRWISTTPDRQWTEGKCAPANRTADLSLRLTDDRRQTWEGFGGCFNELGWNALKQLPAAKRQRVMRELFDPRHGAGCRFTVCRTPIGANDYAAEWYSLNEHDGDFAMRKFSIARDRTHLLPYIQEALALNPQITLFASPWSPPTWMRFPRAYNYGTMIWTKEILRAYALYFVRYVQAYAREGVTIHQVHPQNEPLAAQNLPSCLWTGAQLREFIRDYLGPAMAKAKLSTEIWLGTLNTDDYDGFVNAVLSDPRANRMIRGVGFQWAGKGAIQRSHAAWPDKRMMQTENECGYGENNWEYARYVYNLIQHYITNGANAYCYWNIVLQPGGRSTWGWSQNSMITVDPEKKTVRYNPEFYVMKHFAHFIDPGARRIRLAGPMCGNAVAFENPDRTRISVVNNPMPEARVCTVGDDDRAYRATLPPMSFNTFAIPAAQR
jgi:glucosylceramidase